MAAVLARRLDTHRLGKGTRTGWEGRSGGGTPPRSPPYRRDARLLHVLHNTLIGFTPPADSAHNSRPIVSVTTGSTSTGQQTQHRQHPSLYKQGALRPAPLNRSVRYDHFNLTGMSDRDQTEGSNKTYLHRRFEWSYK